LRGIEIAMFSDEIKKVKELLRKLTGNPRFQPFSTNFVSTRYLDELIPNAYQNIVPQLESGVNVVVERYTFDSQVFIEMLADKEFHCMAKIMDCLPVPDLGIYLEVGTGTALDRIDMRVKTEGIDKNGHENYRMLTQQRDLIEEKKSSLPYKVINIDASKSHDEVHDECIKIIDEVLCPQYIDLHLHSTYSDGRLTPQQLVDLEKEKNIRAIAITDHDNITGCNEAVAIGKQLGIEVITGIELSGKCMFTVGTEKKSVGVHLIGLSVDTNNDQLVKYCDQKRVNDIERTKQTLNKLTELGLKVSFDDFKSCMKMECGGKFFLTQYLIHKGIVKDFNEAKELYFDHGKPACIEKNNDELNFEEGVNLIHQAGGIAILAHPSMLKLCLINLEKLVLDMKQMGLDGMEVYHSGFDSGQSQSKFVNQLLKEFATKFDLQISGGSDYHGEYTPRIQFGTGIDNNVSLFQNS
jgi:predicted metal-dependent phosphoesterase TrpH/thymidylate kinase